MKFSKNPIFWWAIAIFVLGLVLFAVTTRQSILLLSIVLAYLLRPTLASLGLAKKFVDERQMSLNYRSSNIAFLVMMFACVFLAVRFETEDNSMHEMFYMLIIIGIASKAVFSVLLKKNFRETAPKIIISFGLLMTLFAAISNFDHGIFSLSFIMNVLPCLFVVGVGIIAKYFPRAGAIGIFIFAVLLGLFQCRGGFTWEGLLAALIFGFPLYAAAFVLWKKPVRLAE